MAELWTTYLSRIFFGEKENDTGTRDRGEKFPKNHEDLGYLYQLCADVLRGGWSDVDMRRVLRGLKDVAFDYDYRMGYYSSQRGFTDVTKGHWKYTMSDAAAKAFIETYELNKNTRKHKALLMQILKVFMALHEEYEVY